MIPSWMITTSAFVGLLTLMLAGSIPVIAMCDWFGEVNKQRKALKKQKVLDCYPDLVDRTDKLTKELQEEKDRLHGRITALMTRVAFLEDQLYPVKKGKVQPRQRKQIDALREAGIKYDPTSPFDKLANLYAYCRGQYMGRGIFG